MADTLHTVDPSTEPFLSGRFAPVTDEIAADRLAVAGHAARRTSSAPTSATAPTPGSPPLGSYTYPLEGDGMVHGVWLDGRRGPLRQPLRPHAGHAGRGAGRHGPCSAGS